MEPPQCAKPSADCNGQIGDWTHHGPPRPAIGKSRLGQSTERCDRLGQSKGALRLHRDGDRVHLDRRVRAVIRRAHLSLVGEVDELACSQMMELPTWSLARALGRGEEAGYEVFGQLSVVRTPWRS